MFPKRRRNLLLWAYPPKKALLVGLCGECFLEEAPFLSGECFLSAEGKQKAHTASAFFSSFWLAYAPKKALGVGPFFAGAYCCYPKRRRLSELLSLPLYAGLVSLLRLRKELRILLAEPSPLRIHAYLRIHSPSSLYAEKKANVS